MNNNIINEFKRLISFYKDQSDEFRKDKKMAEVNKNSFRIKRLSTVLSILKTYPNEITLDNYKKLKDIQGIGKGSVDRIKEILEKGKIVELGNYKDTKTEMKTGLNELEEIVGIGRAHALELYEKGATSIDKLKKMIKDGKIEVNDKIKLGLKYHGVYQLNIPRKEIDQYYKLLQKIIDKINKKLELSDDKKYIFEICGSYRREKLTSGDIDVLISKKGMKNENKSDKHLNRIVKILKGPMKLNSNKPLLVDDMTDKNIETKYMGFSKYKDNPVRRIDIRFINYRSYYSALLYFTGSGDLNKKMRQIAKTKGYKLSEYGLFDEDGNMVKVKSERDIFKFLDMEYLPPRLR